MKQRRLILLVLAAALAVTVRLDHLRHAPERIEGLLTQSREARMLTRYGECEPSGYGFLQRVLAAFPDPERRPAIRYQRYNRRTEYHVEPTRFPVVPQVLVGIGFTEAQTEEQLIDTAQRVGDSWTFLTRIDIDALTAFEVDTRALPVGVPVRLSLHDGERVLWQSSANSDASSTLRLTPERPLKPFSLARGPEPYRVTIDPAEDIASVRVLGKEMDTSEHEIVHREGACFVGFDKDWLRALSAEERNRWMTFARFIPLPERR